MGRESQGFGGKNWPVNPFLVYIILSETWSWEKLLESPSHALWLIHGEMEAQGASMDGCPRPPGNLEAKLQVFRTVQIRPSDLLSTPYSFTQQTAWERLWVKYKARHHIFSIEVTRTSGGRASGGHTIGGLCFLCVVSDTVETGLWGDKRCLSPMVREQRLGGGSWRQTGLWPPPPRRSQVSMGTCGRGGETRAAQKKAVSET